MKGESASRSGEKALDRSESKSNRMNKNERNAKDEGSGYKNRSARDEDRDYKTKHNAREERSKYNKGERNARGEERDRKADRSRADERRGNAGTGASEGTEGRGGGHRGSVANVTTEQKTRIKTIFSQHHVAPVRNLGVAVNVGVAIPRSVHVYPVPEDIVTIVPDYSGYMYFMIDEDRVAIVDPDTYEVVDIIVIA
jgi:hypothetical protein